MPRPPRSSIGSRPTTPRKTLPVHDDRTDPILQTIRKLAAAGEVRLLSDGELLGRFVARRDDAAFETLVHRHGLLVWRVCRRLLPDPHAAEDAFQAVFLVLVRKAASIGRPELLANWLYGVASRVAARAGRTAARQAARERAEADLSLVPDAAETRRDDLGPLVEEALRGLPAKYRTPILLCYLEGRTNEDAARQLQWPVGTLKVRLLRARAMLRTRLARQGVALSAGALAAALAPGPAPAAVLVETTLRGALRFARGGEAIAAPVLTLANGVLKTMWWTKPKLGAVALLAVSLLGAGLLAYRTAADEPAAARTNPATTARPERNLRMPTDIDRLQGTWNITSLESNGQAMGEAFVNGAKIIIQGDAFTTVSMGATYKGTFKVDPSRTPKTLDLTFTEGPEKGQTTPAIYELDGDTWKICLAVTAKNRPKQFATTPGSGHALETLCRETGKVKPAKAPAEPVAVDPPPAADEKTTDAVKQELARLAGEWAMASGEMEGQPLPEAMVKTGKRVVQGNQVTVTMGGQLLFKATITVDVTKSPKTIEFAMTEGFTKGKKQLGIYELDGDTFRSCFASPGKDRPTGFTTRAGDGQTLSLWKRARR